MKRKIFCLLLSVSLFLLFFPKETKAFVSTTPLTEELKASEYQAGSSIFNTTTNTVNSLNILILGSGDEELDTKLGAAAIPTVNYMIASLYSHPPASSIYYLADLGARLNLVQPAYAQGIGYSGLRPLLPLWKASRNIAYTIIVLVFLFIGLGIMLRIKISPQAVITIQQAIPKALITLVLITFSYAIAGLMIDLMYLTIGVAGGMLASSKLIQNDLLSDYIGMGFFDIMGKLLKEGWSSGWQLVFGVWEGMGVEKELPNKILGAISGAIPILILAITLLFLTFKIFLSLLSAYIQIIIAIITAPFQLMLSAIPGQNTFGSWISNLVKNLLIFPGVILAFALGEVLANLPEGDKLWAPPLLGGGMVNSDVIVSVLSLGILLLTASIPDIIKSMFEKKPFPYGSAIGEAAKIPGKAIGSVSTAASTLTAIGQAYHTRFGTRGTPPGSQPSSASEDKPASSEGLPG